MYLRNFLKNRSAKFILLTVCASACVCLCGSLITENIHSQSALRRLGRLSIAGGHVADWHLKLGAELFFFLWQFQEKERKKKKQISSLSPPHRLSACQWAQCLVAAGAKSDGDKRWFGD